MKTRMKAFLVAMSGAIAAMLVASSFAPGGRAVSAEVPDALSAARPEMVMISTAALDGLEQRVSYLEEVVASLTLASHHISAYQLCISGDDGAETCLTKPQLDALLATQAHVAEAAPQAIHAGGGGSLQQAILAGGGGSLPEAPKVAVTTPRKPEHPEPAATAAADDISNADPESTGSIPLAAAPAKAE